MAEKKYIIDNPTLMEEWHWEKNNALGFLPNAFSHGSHQKVWWICKQGHSWQSVISKRWNGQKCPYCIGSKALVGFNDLATINAELAREWDFEKNTTSISKYRPFSNKKVWWKCLYGHSWQAVIAKRVQGEQCPFCQGKKVEPGFNDLATTHPELTSEWDYTKNQRLSPNTTSKGSTQKVWWKCRMNHSWQASIYSRSNGSACPICAKELQSSFPEKALYYYISKYIPNAISGYKFHELNNLELDIYIPQYQIGVEYDGEYWHQNIDKDIKKNLIFAEQGIKLIRVREPKCPAINDDNSINLMMKNKKKDLPSIIKQVFSEISKICGVEYLVSIDLQKDNSKILQLLAISKKQNNLYFSHPHLVKEWDSTKNEGLSLESFTSGSEKKVWWLCSLGHSYYLSILDKTKGRGCPICAGKVVLPGFNDLASKNPELLSKWDYSRNQLKPNEIGFGSDKKCWWICPQGHSYTRSINNEKIGKSCPFCSGKSVLKGFNDISTTHPLLTSEWCNELNDLCPTEVSAGSHKKVWWKCSTCSHKWRSAIYSRTAGHGCPKCSQKKKR